MCVCVFVFPIVHNYFLLYLYCHVILYLCSIHLMNELFVYFKMGI